MYSYTPAQHNGRPIITQAEFARRMHTHPSRVAKWVQEQRLKSVNVPNWHAPMVYADQPLPTPLKRGRKARGMVQ